MKKNKVVFIIKSLNGGGAEKVVINLCKLLRINEGIDSHIIIFSKQKQHLVDDDINIHYIDLPKKTFFNSLSWKKNCAKIIDNYIKANIEDVQAVFSNLTFCDKIMYYSKMPVCHIIHSTTSIAEWESKKGISRLLAKIKTKRYYANHPSICVSKGVLEDFKKNINTNAIYIYNPIDKENIISLSEKGIAIQDKYLLNKEYIVAVGNIKRAKNYTLLIKAYAESKIKENLIIIGNHADEYQKCLELIKRLNLNDKVFMIGFRANPYPYIKKAKLFVLSSIYEGLPTVLLEAMSLGIPVVSTNCESGPSEILVNFPKCLSKVNDENELCLKIMDAINNPNKYIAQIPEEMSDINITKKYKEFILRKL